MALTREQLNSLIVTHAQDGNFELSAKYQQMLKDLDK